MIASGIQTDAEVGAEKRGTKLGNQLFYRIGARTEPTGEIAIEPHGVPRPVHELMEQNRVERFGWGAGIGADKVAPLRHSNAVKSHVVTSALTTVENVGAK